MEILNLIILLGAIQGLILSIVLFFSKAHPGTKFLGALIFVLAYNGFETYSWSSESDFIFFSLFPFVIIFAAGPSLYFYVNALLQLPSPSRSRLYLHFLPVAFLAIFRIAMFGLHWHAISNRTAIAPLLYEIEMWFVSFSEPMSFISYAVYLWMSWRSFHYNVAPHSPEQAIASRWAKNLLTALTVVAFAWLLTVIAPHLLVPDSPLDLHYYPIELFLVVLVYWITFAGYHRTKIVQQTPVKNTSPSLDQAVVERCKVLLRESMTSRRLYLDPELTVAKVSAHINFPPKVISAVINQHMGLSFNDYINRFRVDEVKSRLLNKQDQNFTITGIAMECGFNSQATFQRAFKLLEKQSPKEFLSKNLKKEALDLK